MRSHVIALQKAKLRLIGMQDDEDKQIGADEDD